MVLTSRFCESHQFVAGVEHGEATRAVGGFDRAAFETGLPDQCGLLVAGDAADGNGRAEQLRRRFAEIVGAVLHLGQQRGGDIEDLEQLVVPGIVADVVQQGARGIAGIGDMHLAAGEPPEQETVDGAEGQLTCLGAGAGARHIVQQPGDLGAREIGIEQQAGLFAERWAPGRLP